MSVHKITCQQCPEYGKCSTKTRMYVNYCGSRSPSLEQQIRTAVRECRSRGGSMLQKHILGYVDIRNVRAELGLELQSA